MDECKMSVDQRMEQIKIGLLVPQRLFYSHKRSFTALNETIQFTRIQLMLSKLTKIVEKIPKEDCPRLSSLIKTVLNLAYIFDKMHKYFTTFDLCSSKKCCTSINKRPPIFSKHTRLFLLKQPW